MCPGIDTTKGKRAWHAQKAGDHAEEGKIGRVEADAATREAPTKHSGTGLGTERKQPSWILPDKGGFSALSRLQE